MDKITLKTGKVKSFPDDPNPESREVVETPLREVLESLSRISLGILDTVCTGMRGGYDDV
jgi:hypothetical protein